MKSKILIFIILVVLIVFGIIYINKNEIKFKNKITINVGDKIPNINDYANKKIKDIDIKFKDIELENNKVYKTGTYISIFKYQNKKYKVKLEVIDNIKPNIEGVKDIEIYENEDIDLFKDIVITDNSKDDIKKEIIGNYDIKQPGEYNLKYAITDKSQNKTEAEFKLIIKAKQVISTQQKVEQKGTTSKGYKIEQIDGIYYINGILIANKSYDLAPDYNPGGLLKEFMDNYNNMKTDAIKSGINLNIISGFRSYQTQSNLYSRYVARDGKDAADTYSARPGHSEHQTGLAADINSVDQNFEYTNEGKWLNDNCYKYGFIIRYPKGKESITGYIFEPWHIRYVGKTIAQSLYNNGNWITLEEYLGITSKY